MAVDVIVADSGMSNKINEIMYLSIFADGLIPLMLACRKEMLGILINANGDVHAREKNKKDGRKVTLIN